MIDIEEYIRNPVKRHILGLLKKNKTLKYSELLPPEVDNVLFNYHLQHLVKNGLVTKNENYYSFSVKGQRLTSNTTDTGLYFPRFVCNYKLYLVEKGKVLLAKRKISPWYGDTTALSSKAVYGTGVEERANIRIKQKTGASAKMKWIGTIRTRVFNRTNDLIDDALYFICYAVTYRGDIRSVDDNKCPLAWYSFDRAIQVEKANRGSGDKTIEVLKRLKSNNFEPFVFEEMVHAESL